MNNIIDIYYYYLNNKNKRQEGAGKARYWIDCIKNK